MGPHVNPIHRFVATLKTLTMSCCCGENCLIRCFAERYPLIPSGSPRIARDHARIRSSIPPQNPFVVLPPHRQHTKPTISLQYYPPWPFETRCHGHWGLSLRAHTTHKHPGFTVCHSQQVHLPPPRRTAKLVGRFFPL